MVHLGAGYVFALAREAESYVCQYEFSILRRHLYRGEHGADVNHDSFNRDGAALLPIR